MISRSEAAGLFASSDGHRCKTFSSNRANLCVTFTREVSRRRRERATEVLSAGQISAWRDTSERATVVPMQRSTTTG